MKIQLQKMRLTDLKTLSSWFSEIETKRRLGGLPPLNDWFENTEKLANYKKLLAIVDGEIIGMATIEEYSDNSASISVLVNPARRKVGFGRQIVMEILTFARPNLTIHAYIEVNNISSIRLFTVCGFTKGKTDTDGFTDFVFINL
jgi:RimJ/RimL family protein N-acetyltransferase